MDTERNQPAPDREPSTEFVKDPTAIWSPQPSTVYDLHHQAEAEQAKHPGASALDRAAEGIAANEPHTSDPVAMQGCPFRAADHEVVHTEARVNTDLETDIPLRSGQGQSGFSEPPAPLPARGPVIELPAPTRERRGT